MSNRSEKMLLVADREIKLKPKEEWGANRGPLVDKYIRSAGLEPSQGHFPWCASFVNYCALEAGYTKAELPKGPAAVRNWKSWAEDKGILTTDLAKVERGDLGCWVDPKTQLGHIFLINEVKRGPFGVAAVRTSEGNTDADGSREGDGAYKKWRIVGKSFLFIRMTNLP